MRPLSPDAQPVKTRRRSRFNKLITLYSRIRLRSPGIRAQLTAWEAAGHGRMPVCIAKTQYSFSTDPELRGAPNGHIIPVREVRLNAGAGFVVARAFDESVTALERFRRSELQGGGTGSRVVRSGDEDRAVAHVRNTSPVR